MDKNEKLIREKIKSMTHKPKTCEYCKEGVFIIENFNITKAAEYALHLEAKDKERIVI